MAEHLLSRKFSWQLSILVFLVGVASMSLEFSASRLLTPVFGSTIYTWGSLIGVILAGLSLGYYVGGKLADKEPSISKLCSIIFSAGLYIVLIPFLSPVVLEFANDSFAPPQQSQYASLVATIVLLIMPTFLLGIISPYAVKLATSTLSRLGNIAGNFYALSTIGSIIGTFLTVFVLIPSFEIRYIIFALGSILLVFSAFMGLKRFPKALAISTVVLLFLPTSSLIAGAVSHSGTLVYEKETLYSHLDVTDSGNIRTLYLNGLPHSAMYKDDPNELVFTYTKYFQLGFVFNNDVKNVLFVGGGGFSGPKSFLDTYPDVKIDVVEIDPDVIDVAKKYFSLSSDSSRLGIFNEDARSFLSNTYQKYDLIVLDAFSKSYVPFHLMTLEYFEILDKRLTPDGIIVSNLIGTLSGDTSDLLRAVYKTMSQVFPTLYVFTTRDFDSGQVQNIMVVASKMYVQYSKPQLAAMLDDNKDPVNTSDNNDRNIDFVKHLYGEEIRTADVPILTDQYAPVEQLLNPLTGRPYTVDEQIGTENIELPWTERGSTVFVVLGLIVFSWMWQFREIWKTQGHKIPSH